jgi:hypothetical protein
MTTATTFGMEFEVQGISPSTAASRLNAAGIACERPDTTHDTCENWKAVYDGSVRNGAEIVSPILTANRLNEAHKVTKVLKESGAHVDRATGFHVHIGLNAFGDESTGVRHLTNFIMNWYAGHHAISALVAPSRLNNRFCRVLNQQYAERQASFTLNNQVGAFNGDRYTSLNLESVRRHGTVEVRLHQGTLNGVKAIAWSQLIAGMIDATKIGLNLTDTVGITPWSHQTSVEQCQTLLDALVSLDCLNASTGDWLKTRAARLNG